MIAFKHANRLRATAGQAWLLLVCMAVSAWCFGSFSRMWGMLEGQGNGIEQMLDYSASRPFVYRVLVPLAANGAAAIAEQLPSSLQQRLSATPLTTYRGHVDAWAPPYSLKYRAVYYISYAACVLLMLCLHGIGRTLLGPGPRLMLYPIIFMTLLPLTFLRGGYFYDFTELLLIAAITLAILSERDWLFAPLLVIAVINKESAVLIVPIVLPLLVERKGLMGALRFLVPRCIPAALVMLSVRYMFSGNPGAGAEWHLEKNIWFWLGPSNWVRFMRPFNPDIPFPKSSNIVIVALGIATLALHWRAAGKAMQRMLVTALAVNVPIVLLFCYRDEMRNFSLSFIPFYCYMVAAQRQQAPQAQPPAVATG